MTAFRSIALLVLIVVLAAIGYLGYKSLGPDLENHYLTTETFRRLETADRSLNDEILRSRLALSADYDTIAGIFPRIYALIDSLKSGPQSITGKHGIRLDRAIDDYVTLIEGKEDLTERFKSHNAILRNSINYVPVEGATFNAKVRNTADANISEPLNSMLRSVLEYNLLGSNNARAEVAGQIGELTVSRETLPEELQSTLDDLLNHANTMLREKPLSDNLLNEIINIDTQEYLNNVRNGYLASHEVSQRQATFHRWLLAALSLLAFIGAGFLYFNRKERENDAILEARSETDIVKASWMQTTEQLEQEVAKNKNMLQHLEQSEQRAAIGQVSVNIAQSVATPLSDIANKIILLDEQVDNLQQSFSKQATTFNHIEQSASTIEEAKLLISALDRDNDLASSEEKIGHCHSLINDIADKTGTVNGFFSTLTSFSSSGDDVKDQVNLNDELHSVLQMLNWGSESKVSVEEDFSQLPPVYCSPARIRLVFVCLLNYIQDSMDESGQLVILTRHIQNKKLVAVAFRDLSRAQLDEDQATPMATNENAANSLNPSKAGLAVARKIIAEHYGTLQVATTSSKGTKFIMALPVV